MLFVEGLSLTAEIMEGKRKWADLFAPSNFFQRYRHFIVVIAQTTDVVSGFSFVFERIAKTYLQQEHLVWAGLVESKILMLVDNFERRKGVELVHVNPTTYVMQKAEGCALEKVWDG